MRRTEPWRFATLPISLALAVFLEWALSEEHSPAFWWLTAFGVSAAILGNVHLSLYLRARWEHKQQREDACSSFINPEVLVLCATRLF
jgi:hypothetical protein